VEAVILNPERRDEVAVTSPDADARRKHGGGRQWYIARAMGRDIYLAQRAEDTNAGERLLAFYVAEIEHGYPPPEPLLAHLARAFRSALSERTNRVLAQLEGAPGSLVKAAVTDVNRHLGLRGSVGAPTREDDESIVELTMDCADRTMRGESIEAVVKDALEHPDWLAFRDETQAGEKALRERIRSRRKELVRALGPRLRQMDPRLARKIGPDHEAYHEHEALTEQIASLAERVGYAPRWVRAALRAMNEASE